MSAINKLMNESSYDVTLTHKGFSEKTGHMLEAVVILLEDGGKEVELANKVVKESTKLTKKRVSVLSVDADFDVASDKALAKAAELLGL